MGRGGKGRKGEGGRVGGGQGGRVARAAHNPGRATVSKGHLAEAWDACGAGHRLWVLGPLAGSLQP